MKMIKIVIIILSVITTTVSADALIDRSYNTGNRDHNINFTYDNLRNGNLETYGNKTVFPNITILPILTFEEEEGTFTEEEKNNYRQLFTEFLKLQDDGRITKFFYSSDGNPLQKLEIRKTLDTGAAFHGDTYVGIFDNGKRAGMSQRDFFFHEMGHLIVYFGHSACCGKFPISEGMANIVVSEANKGQPSKVILGETLYYSGVIFPEQWYKHAEKWNYTLTSHIVGGDPLSDVTTREDREFVYVAQVSAYNALVNGKDIGNDSTLMNALDEAINIKNYSTIPIPTEDALPNITLLPVLTFDETQGTFTEEEKNNYVQLFDEFLKLQHDRRITNFFYSSDGNPLQKLEISKIVSGAGAFHGGTHVEIWDNGIRAGLSQRKFFFHEMGHLIAFVGYWTCCGRLAEGMAGLVVSEAYNDKPNKIIFNGVTYYTDAVFAEQWYKHAEKWNYPIINHTTNDDMTLESTIREDREFIYIVQALVYKALINGESIGNESVLMEAVNNAINIENRTFLVVTPSIRGDVNRNSILDAEDATLILRYLVELPTPSEYLPILPIGDMNCNNIIDADDAILILRDIVGLDISRCWE